MPKITEMFAFICEDKVPDMVMGVISVVLIFLPRLLKQVIKTREKEVPDK